MGQSLKPELLCRARLRDAMGGDMESCFELGVAYSMGSDGCPVDLVAAHKWFNIAAMAGDRRAAECRAEIAGDMTAREVIEAQRQARAMMGSGNRLAA